MIERLDMRTRKLKCLLTVKEILIKSAFKAFLLFFFFQKTFSKFPILRNKIIRCGYAIIMIINVQSA